MAALDRSANPGRQSALLTKCVERRFAGKSAQAVGRSGSGGPDWLPYPMAEVGSVLATAGSAQGCPLGSEAPEIGVARQRSPNRYVAVRASYNLGLTSRTIALLVIRPNVVPVDWQ